MRAQTVFTLTVLAAILGSFSAPGAARAEGSKLLRLLPSSVLYRALVGERSPSDSHSPQADDEDRALSEAELAATPTLPELPELPEQPDALSSDELAVEAPAAEFSEEEFEFQYDENLPIEPDPLAGGLLGNQGALEPTPAEQLLPEPAKAQLPSEERSVLNRGVAEAVAEEVEPLAPVPRFPLPPDPFFGSVSAMLGAQGPQTVIPAEAVLPPAPARFFNGRWMNLDPWGTPATPVDELASLRSGEPLDLNTSGAGDAQGRAVLLVDGRALLVRSLQWSDRRVTIQLPELELTKPTIARVYLADAAGTVQDYADFMLE